MRYATLYLNRLGLVGQAFLTLPNNYLEFTELQRKAALKKQAQQKAIDETDLWHQYRKQSEKMNRIRTQTHHRKQSAVHDAKNQTIVLNASPVDESLSSSEKTSWSKIIQKNHFKDSEPSTQIILGGISFPTKDDMSASFGGSYTPPKNDKKYYDLGDLKTLDDYLNDPFASSKTIFSVTTPDKKVYTLIPYANAAASPNITCIDASLLLDTGLSMAIRYGASVARTLAPYATRGLGIVGTVLVAKEAAEFAWDGTKELAKYIFAPDPVLESFIYDSTKHLSVSYIKGKENTIKASLAATREIDLDTCYMMRDWSFLQKFQYFVDKADFWGNIYLNPRSLPWLDGTAKHRILHYQIREYNARCKDMSIRSEIPVLDGEIYYTGRPLSMRGASIVDGIRYGTNEQNYYEAADFKSSILGITKEQAEKLSSNMPFGARLKYYGVRASNSVHGVTEEFDLTSLKLKQ